MNDPMTSPLKRLALLATAALSMSLSVCGVCSGGSTTLAYSKIFGGNVTGLSSGATLTLLVNGAAHVTVSTNGRFTLPIQLATGASYSITVGAHPVGQACAVTNGTGTVGNTTVLNVSVVCTAGVKSVLHYFGTSTDGQSPQASLILDGAGNLYGTTPSGGTNGTGTVFKITPAGVESVLHSFGGGTDGETPAGLILDGAGNLVGTTEGGGTHNTGTVFKITPLGVYSMLYSFGGGIDGENPTGLILDGAGNLVGTTDSGGTQNAGTVFKITPAGVESVLYSFGGGTDGDEPTGLILDGAGNLVGTTDTGGTNGAGTVFKITPAGMESVLHTFGTGTDGKHPKAGLILDGARNLIGTTDSGGTNGDGTVFKITPAGVESVMYSFAPSAGIDGWLPRAGLIMDGAGNLVGTTDAGGTNDEGTVFKINPAGVESVLYSFGGGTDGQHPQSRLILDGAGNLVGTTDSGGTHNAGTVFKITPAGVESVLYSFGPSIGIDGRHPGADLILDGAGNLYGPTADGGTNDSGTVFKIIPAGVYSVLYSFGPSAGIDGRHPQAGLIMDRAGNLIGTNAGDGTVFKITPAGVESVLHSFGGGTDDENPQAGLIMDRAGNLYGTTDRTGTVFKITPSGVYSVQYSFGPDGNTNGEAPQAGLIMDRAGNLYGTTDGAGTVFKISPAGVESVLHSFGYGTDGRSPQSGLILDGAGNLYGTTAGGGTHNTGTVFKITPAGVESVLYSFGGGTDGQYPTGLILDSAGNLYGTTASGGTHNTGTVFKITPAGLESVLFSFSGGTDGQYPTGLILDSAGNLYGTTAGGGINDSGTVFKIN